MMTPMTPLRLIVRSGPALEIRAWVESEITFGIPNHRHSVECLSQRSTAIGQTFDHACRVIFVNIQLEAEDVAIGPFDDPALLVV